MSYFPSVAISDGINLDASNRLRISHPENLFDSVFQYDLEPLLWEQIIGSGGSITHLPNESSAQLTLPVTTAIVVAMQTFQYFLSQPMKGLVAMLSFTMGAAVANITKRSGIFDANNGIFLEQKGVTDVAIVSRTFTSGSAVDTRVVQASWNLDKLDGTGPSGATLDLSKIQILRIDMQAMGAGRVRVGFDIGGVIVWAHQFLNSNVLALPFATSINLPLRHEMTNTATSAGGSMKATAAGVIVDGGLQDVAGMEFSTENTVTAGSGTRTHLLSIQKKTTFNSIANRYLDRLVELDFLVSGTNPILWELCLGQALTTPSFGDVNATYSGMQVDVAGTLSGSPAIVVAQGYLAAAKDNYNMINEPVETRYSTALDAAGAARLMGRYTLLVTGLGGTSACRGAIRWRESR